MSTHPGKTGQQKCACDTSAGAHKFMGTTTATDEDSSSSGPVVVKNFAPGSAGASRRTAGRSRHDSQVTQGVRTLMDRADAPRLSAAPGRVGAGKGAAPVLPRPSDFFCDASEAAALVQSGAY
ncbi:hypothetical protein GCM10010495_78410 [Kitasatospora herbaricolor]|nr:hypothetical protein GCM10010495_78410 [Kitasatospora herbaricolor]